MKKSLARQSTWLILEISATSLLTILNLCIPIFLSFKSFRNLINFYFASLALSSSLINFLYLFYLIQTFREKPLSELNCRAMFYFQTSCIIVLAYTVVAIHINLIFSLFSSNKSQQSTYPCLLSCTACFRRFIRRFCFGFVLITWALSFTGTIPLLYTIDSNEKIPRIVYCPGSNEVTHLDQWFDRERFTQTLICNLLPFIFTVCLTLIALLKFFSDFISYLYCYFKTYRCFQCKQMKMESIDSSISLIPISSNVIQIESQQDKFLRLFIRFTVILSCCLLACIYPIVMHSYLIYFSVLIPLVYAVINHSARQINHLQTRNSSQLVKVPLVSSESIELRTPLLASPSCLEENETSSVSSIYSTLHPQHLSNSRNQRKSFTNNLYENTRNLLTT